MIEVKSSKRGLGMNSMFGAGWSLVNKVRPKVGSWWAVGETMKQPVPTTVPLPYIIPMQGGRGKGTC